MGRGSRQGQRGDSVIKVSVRFLKSGNEFWRALTGKTLQHPFDLVQASWAPCGGLGGWFHSRATDVAAPIAGLIGIGYVALVMARQTSLQVTTLKLTFSFSWVSAVSRQYLLCLAIQFGYIMSRWNQRYFVPQFNICPETIDTDQIIYPLTYICVYIYISAIKQLILMSKSAAVMYALIVTSKYVPHNLLAIHLAYV